LKAEESKQELLEKHYIPNLGYDAVIFGYNGNELKILILEYHNTNLFALPGGFLKKDENLDDAVRENVTERTGIKNLYLEQFHTFGKTSRHSPEIMKTILKSNNIVFENDYWLLNRFISVGYYALINYNEVTLKPDHFSDSIQWYSLEQLPTLMMDHNDIVNKALQTLQLNLDEKLIGMNLLPEKFTMKELQQVYESILDKKLRRTSFQRKILAKEILIRHDKQFTGSAHKAPYLYSFK